jgi:hypothetical protein
MRRSSAPAQHLTLMRTPVVKRQTTPRSGFGSFFPLGFRLSVIRLWQRVLSSLPLAGAPTWLHQTLIEVRSPLCQRVQRPLWVVSTTEKPLCTLVPSYAKGRLNGCRSPVSLRLGGGAAHVNSRRLSPIYRSRSGCPIKGQRIRAKGPMGSYAFKDAATHALQSTTRRLSPWWSSEAFGSSAPLP